MPPQIEQLQSNLSDKQNGKNGEKQEVNQTCCINGPISSILKKKWRPYGKRFPFPKQIMKDSKNDSEKYGVLKRSEKSKLLLLMYERLKQRANAYIHCIHITCCNRYFGFTHEYLEFTASFTVLLSCSGCFFSDAPSLVFYFTFWFFIVMFWCADKV